MFGNAEFIDTSEQDVTEELLAKRYQDSWRQLERIAFTAKQLRLASWFGPFRHFVLAHPWDVEGLGNIHPVVVGAVGMWESLLSDFQGLWEGWENSFIVFPCFPRTAISTASFG